MKILINIFKKLIAIRLGKKVNYPPPKEVGVFLHFLINSLKELENTALM
jgi:hypothetical protein